MDKVVPRVLEIPDLKGGVDTKIADEVKPLLEDVELLSPDALKTVSATFLRADTLSLLYQYQYLTTRFTKDLQDHAKRVAATKDELAAAKSKSLSKPKYGIVLLDNTDQGGIISGTLVTIQGEPKVRTESRPAPPEEEEPAPDPKDKKDKDKPDAKKDKKPAEPAMVKYTISSYKLKAGFETEAFDRDDEVSETGSPDVRTIANPELFPDYGETLLADYEARVVNLKVHAEAIQRVQKLLAEAIAKDVSRQVDFTF
jgi:hypothetical protein